MQKYIECGYKIINGKKRVLFKTSNSKKQYIKFKGNFIALSTYRKLFSSNKKGGSNEFQDGDLVLLYDRTNKVYLKPDLTTNGLYYYLNDFRYLPVRKQPAGRKLTTTEDREDPNVLWKIDIFKEKYKGKDEYKYTYEFILQNTIDDLITLNSAGNAFFDDEKIIDRNVRYFLSKEPRRFTLIGNYLKKSDDKLPDIEVRHPKFSIKDLILRETTGRSRNYHHTLRKETGSLMTT
jgi:hypothetical protein